MDYCDPLGFTRQTEILLRGLGATNLIKECKRKNVSTNVLHKLNKEDFITLGADEDQAESMVKVLHISSDNRRIPTEQKVKPKPHHKIADHVVILESSERQLRLVRDYLSYAKIRLTRERINFFVDPDKALSASQILRIAIDATLKEVTQAESDLKELEFEIDPFADRYSYMPYYIPISGGIAVVTWILLRTFWK